MKKVKSDEVRLETSIQKFDWILLALLATMCGGLSLSVYLFGINIVESVICTIGVVGVFVLLGMTFYSEATRDPSKPFTPF